MERHAFAAMGTQVELFLDAVPGPDSLLALASAEIEFERLEALLSRFRPDSELSRLNAEGELEASDDLLAVVELALGARERTGGRFDPTLHDALVAAGYDRSFELLQAADPPASPGGPAKGGGGVRVCGRRLSLPADVRLDLGGIAKGHAVDRVVTMLAPLGACLVNAGGDIAVAGVPEAGLWPVGVETPVGTLTLGLERGAIATSGRDRRRWRTGLEERHHLIDPWTGRPSGSDLLTVTVACETAVDGEVTAKALFLAGERAAVREADALGVPALLVTEDGRVRTAGGLR